MLRGYVNRVPDHVQRVLGTLRVLRKLDYLFHLLSHTKLCPRLQWQGGLSPFYPLQVLILPYSNLIVFEVLPLPINMSKVFQSLTYFKWLTGQMGTHFVNTILEIMILLSN